MSETTSVRDAVRSRAPRVVQWLASSAAIWFGAACASNSAPRGFLPDANGAQTAVHGGWIELALNTSSGTETIAGELIAVGSDSLWLLNASGATTVPWNAINRGQLVGYDSQPGAVFGGAILGSLLTVSNGVFLLATAPLWIIVGGVAAGHQSRQPIRKLPGSDWMDLRQFARFPQGLPLGVDVRRLRPKR